MSSNCNVSGWWWTGTAVEMHSQNTDTRHSAGDCLVHAFTWLGTTDSKDPSLRIFPFFSSIPNPHSSSVTALTLPIHLKILVDSEYRTHQQAGVLLSLRPVYMRELRVSWRRGYLLEYAVLYVEYLNREQINIVSGFMRKSELEEERD